MPMAIKFAVIEKADVPNNKGLIRGKYARLLAELMDLTPRKAVCVAVDRRTEGHTMTEALRKLAQREGLELQWSRNADSTAFYYWVERKQPATKG
jgi:glucose-6-phosphate dehydrogenase assembly protein OpcA